MAKCSSLRLDAFLSKEIKALSKSAKASSLEDTIQASPEADLGVLPFSPGLNHALQDMLKIRGLLDGRLKENDLLRHVKSQKKGLARQDYFKYLQTMHKNLRDLQKQ